MDLVYDRALKSSYLTRNMASIASIEMWVRLKALCPFTQSDVIISDCYSTYILTHSALSIWWTLFCNLSNFKLCGFQLLDLPNILGCGILEVNVSMSSSCWDWEALWKDTEYKIGTLFITWFIWFLSCLYYCL